MSQSVLFTFLHDKWLKYQGSILCIEMHHTEYRWTLSTGNQSAFMPLLFGRLIHTNPNPISIINQCKQIYPIKTWNNLSFFSLLSNNNQYKCYMRNITPKNQHQSSIRNLYKRCKKILHVLLHIYRYTVVHILQN